jgi:hypothetical protein
MEPMQQGMLVLATFAFGAQFKRWLKTRSLQKRGLIPETGPMTEEHVRKLVAAGELAAAASAFKDMTGLSREDAMDAVRTMAGKSA